MKRTIDTLRAAAEAAAERNRTTQANYAIHQTQAAASHRIGRPTERERLADTLAKTDSVEAVVYAAKARAALATSLDVEDLKDEALAAVVEVSRYREDLNALIAEENRIAEELAAAKQKTQARILEAQVAHVAWTERRKAAGDPPPAPFPYALPPAKAMLGQVITPDARELVRRLDVVISQGGPTPHVDDRAAELDKLHVDAFNSRAAIQAEREKVEADEARAAEMTRREEQNKLQKAAVEKRKHDELVEKYAAKRAEQERLVAAQIESESSK